MDNRIREWRKRRGYSLRKLAEMTNTSNPQIYKLETGERRLSLHWMQRLADALGCTPADLLPAPPTDSPIQTQSPEERAMLEMFRQLPTAQRRAVMSLSGALADPDADDQDGNNNAKEA